MSKVAVVGVGYVGLCTSAGLASLGHEVHSFDVITEKISNLQNGIVHIFEEGLADLVASGIQSGNLNFHNDLETALSFAEFVFLCVPTPQDEDGTADLQYVISAAQSVAKFAQPGAVVITKSTVPVGAAKKVKEALSREDLYVASNPEFLREGTALFDFYNPDRIVAGADDPVIAHKVADLYQNTSVPNLITSTASAELIKYAANAFLAIKLSFVNEIAAICEQSGADINDVTKGFGLDSRIGEKFLKAGPGWGGSCFPKDTRALLAISESYGVKSDLINSAVHSNEKTFDRIALRAEQLAGGSLHGKKIAAWGIAFKAGTDDIRESPAVVIINRLLDKGAEVVAYDPKAKLPAESQAVQVGTMAEAVADAEMLIVLTEWPEFITASSSNFLPAMKAKTVFDTRAILSSDWQNHASTFASVGSK